MKYKIVFDTNQLHCDTKSKLDIDEIFNGNVLNINEFLKEHVKELKDVIICFPQMVIEERIQQRKEEIIKIFGMAIELKRLKVLGYKIPEIKPKSDKKLDDILRKSALKFISTNSIEILDMPKFELDKIINMAIKREKPFDDKTIGFKDAIIFSSIIEDALKSDINTRYIFVSENSPKDFPETLVSKFKEKTNKELFIEKNTESLKARLDEIVPLRLNLENLHNQIKEGVKRKTGTIIVELNKNMIIDHDINRNSYEFWATNYRESYNALNYSGSNNEEDIIGYNFIDINIENISRIDDGDIFEVEGVISVNAQYKEDKDNTKNNVYDVFRDNLRINTYPRYSVSNRNFLSDGKKFNFVLSYDKNSNDISRIRFSYHIS